MQSAKPGLANNAIFAINHADRITMSNNEVAFVGDVGGTGLKVGLVSYKKGVGFHLLASRHYPPNTRPGMAIAKLVSETKTKLMPTRGVYGVAAPLVAGANRCNKGIRVPAIDGDILSKEMGFPIQLRNDFGLLGESIIDGLAPQEVVLLQGWKLQEGMKTWFGPGSGCGLGFGENCAHEVEGSHIRLSARNLTLHAQLLAHLHTRKPSLTFDEILCGEGLLRIFRFLVTKKQKPFRLPVDLKHLMEDSRDPEVQTAKHFLITKNALDNTNVACRTALVLFVEFMGILAQTAALMYGASGGVVCAGGIATNLLKHPGFLPRFRMPFLDSFLDTPAARDKRWLGKTPVGLMRDPHVQSLRGAALCAAKMSV